MQYVSYEKKILRKNLIFVILCMEFDFSISIYIVCILKIEYLSYILLGYFNILGIYIGN